MNTHQKPPNVAVYIDRTGKKRCYYRTKGYNIPLPELGSAEFETAYQKAIAEVTANAQDRSPKHVVERRKNPNARGYIYFLRYNGNVKIGFSERPLVRLAGLRTALPDAVECFLYVQGTRKMERALHKQLDHCRKDGEWFKATTDVEILMAKVAKYGAIPESGEKGEHSLANAPSKSG